jgi:CheY-like chemotaxis protein
VADSPATPSIAGFRVLVVEDNADAREVLALSLSMVGAQVIGAASVDEAIDAGLASFDVAVTDLSMPGRNGYDLLRAAHESEPPVPVIAVSGYSKQQEQERGGAPERFEGYLMKPVDHAELVKTIHRAVHAGGLGESR